MTTEERLKRVRDNADKIRSRRERLAELKARATSLGQMKYESDRVTHSPSDKLADQIAEIVDMANEINDQINEWERERHEAEMDIYKLDDLRYRNVLKAWYIDCLPSWEAVSIKVGYSVEHCYYLRREAVAVLDSLIENNKK